VNEAVSLTVSGYPECAQELIEFRNANRPIPRDRRYFDWRYLERPCAVPAIVIWAESEGRRAGALTVFPHDYHVLDGEYPVGVVGDISVNRDCRGRGIAGAMFRFVTGTEAVCRLRGCLVLPNADAAGPLGKSGWRDTARIERFAKILDVRPRVARLVGNRVAGTLAAPLNLLMRGWSHEFRYRPGRHRSELLPRLDDRFDDLWRRTDKRGAIIGLRDARYLRWRYERHPANSYRMLAINEGESLCGYAMYRVDGDVCYVDDFLWSDGDRDAHHVIGLLLTHLRAQERVSTVSVRVNRPAVDPQWRRFGFVDRHDPQRVMILNCKSPGDDWDAATAATWYFTAGDKDV
jgi:GNAT superfamily N-acetyltransferase